MTHDDPVFLCGDAMWCGSNKPQSSYLLFNRHHLDHRVISALYTRTQRKDNMPPAVNCARLSKGDTDESKLVNSEISKIILSQLKKLRTNKRTETRKK